MQKTAHCNAVSWSYVLSESNEITFFIKRNSFLVLYFPVIMAELSQKMRFHSRLCVISRIDVILSTFLFVIV